MPFPHLVLSTKDVPPESLTASSFAQDLARGLRGRPKHVASKYFYDEVGSALFDRICEQKEYYLTRTELSILNEHAASLTSRVGASAEWSSSAAAVERRRSLFSTPCRPRGVSRGRMLSAAPLEAAAAALRERYRALRVIPVRADFMTAFGLPAPSDRVRATIVYFSGLDHRQPRAERGRRSLASRASGLRPLRHGSRGGPQEGAGAFACSLQRYGRRDRRVQQEPARARRITRSAQTSRSTHSPTTPFMPRCPQNRDAPREL